MKIAIGSMTMATMNMQRQAIRNRAILSDMS